MKGTFKSIFVLGLLLTAAIAFAVEKEKAKGPMPECPVMGGAINRSVSTEYQGGKVYFCCAGCIKPFQSDTAKYAARANLQLVATGQAKQTACPLTGKAYKSSKKATVAGVDVHFCCDGCQRKVSKAPVKKQLKLIFGKGFQKGFELVKK